MEKILPGNLVKVDENFLELEHPVKKPKKKTNGTIHFFRYQK